MAEATETRHKTMRFRHRLYDMRYVIVPDDSARDNWGQVRRIHGIAAKFENYFFDSGAAARVYRWDDDTREMVEKYLLTHEDFNKRGGRGFFLDIGQEIPSYYLEELGDAIKLDPFAGAVQSGLSGPDVRLSCTVTVITPGGPAELCGREVPEGHRFCSLHQEYEEEQDLTVSDDDGPDEFDEAIAVAQEAKPDPRDEAIAALNAKFEQLLAAVAGAQLGVVVEDEPEEPAPKPKPVTKMRVPTKKG